MTKLLDASHRYASVLENEVNAHVASPLSVYSLPEYDYVLSSFNTSLVPQSDEYNGPFGLLKDYIKNHHLQMSAHLVDNLLFFSTYLYWLGKSSCIADYGVATASFLTSIGYGPSKLVGLLGHHHNPLSVFDEDFEITSSSLMQPEGLEKCINYWRLLKTNPIFPKLSTAFSFVSILYVSSLESKKLDFDLLPFLQIKLKELHVTASDVVDACLESLTWLCTTGVAVIRTGSLTPVLYSNPLVREFDEKFLIIQANKNAAINGTLHDVDAYENDLDKCLDIIEQLNDSKMDSLVRRYLHDKYALLTSVKESLYVKRKNCEMRFCPIGFSLFGGSGVGKTSVAKLIMRTSLASMGFPFDDKHQITLDMSDKYHSTLTNDVHGIYFDDLANTTCTFSQNGQIPSSVIIKFFNNVPSQAIKADVGDKGKTMINLKCGVVTTNVKDLDASKYSNCPVSILRRLYHIEVLIKPNYRIPGSTMLNTQHPDLLLQKQIGEVDVWCFNIEEAHPSASNSFIFKPLVHNGRPCISLDLHDLLYIVKDLSINHQKLQSLVLSGTLGNQICICPTCTVPTPVCDCQGLEGDCAYILKSVATTFGYNPVANLSVRDALPCVLSACDRTVVSACRYIPESIYQSFFFQMWLHKVLYRLSDFDCSVCRYIIYHANFIMRIVAIAGVLSLILFLCGFPGSIFLIHFVVLSISLMAFIKSIHATRVRRIEDHIISTRCSLSDLSRNYRDVALPKAFIAVGGLIVVVLGLKFIYKSFLEGKTTPQGSLSPDDIDKQPGWFGNILTGGIQKVFNPISTNSLPSQTLNVLSKNIFYGDFLRADGSTAACCVVCPKKCIAIFPAHMFYTGGNLLLQPNPYVDIVLRRHDSYGGSFSLRINYDKCGIFSDLAICYFPNCPDLKNITHFFSESISGAGYCTMIRRHKDCTIAMDNFYASHGDSGHKYMQFRGSTYHSKLIGCGSCMSYVINDGNPSSIVGFHIGGNGTLGTSIHLPQSVLLKAIDDVVRDSCGVHGSDSDEIPISSYGKSLITGPVHQHAYATQLGTDSCFDVLGSTKVNRDTKSSVEPSYLHEYMLNVFGPIDKWKKPDMQPNYKHYNVFLDKVTKPCHQFDNNLLELAVRDYIAPLYVACVEYKGLRKPLTLKESVMGIPGVRFCDALIMGTSMGFPLFGKKKKFFTDVIENNVLIDRVPDLAVIHEYNRLIECYKRGERGYPVFAACLKDEVKDVDSDKVRVFTACPVAFSMVVRQYYLPIAIFLQHFPLESEMAVGINAFGLQWQDLMDFSESFGDGEGGHFGMDYSSYDTRMNSQISRSVYYILIQLAQNLGYSREDLAIMEAMVDDLTHPLVDVYGTLFQLFHMNPSGNNITVQVNCIANSLYMRMAFYDTTHLEVPFRDCVHLITYGDDNKCSVSPEVRHLFTFESVKHFLGAHDIKITPPDKKSESSEFFALDKLDFLKRQSSFIPEINRSIGRLDENSIFKSLMYNVKGSVHKRDVALSCIDSALHEWFAFGRAHYEKRRAQLIEVCQQANLSDYPILYVDFSERTQRWLNSYRPVPE
uniref:Nonstructural polyprotein n=1 Tax=Biomphalaria pfeifferi virus 1 TaxID=2884319 RepID=A0A8K1UAN6_9VIRU|nr:MAG: nonstructural polyprotein [Biomphalaria pfeifferi virus 1]